MLSSTAFVSVPFNFEGRFFKMKQLLRGLWRDEAGQDLTEYALLLVLIAMAAVASMNTLASTIKNVYSNAAANLSTAT
jgi:pilus assembly protein Flp/PilA